MAPIRIASSCCGAIERALIALLLTALAAAQSPVRVATTAALQKALAAATPGTVIAVASGDYDGFAIAGVTGSAAKPVVVRAETPAAPPRFRGGIHASDLAFVTIDGITIENAPGNGLNIDDGGSFATPSHDVVLRHVTVRDAGGTGNDDGIKLSGVTDLRVDACTVERWGRGGSAIDMVGCHRVVVAACTFRDREDGTAATGVQMKGGSRDVIVRGCRFEHAGERAVNLGGSTGLPYFRPAPAGYEAKDVTVEGCTFVGSLAPIAFVGVDGATVRFNTFVRPRKWVLRILQETREPGFVPCRGGVFTDNLVVVHGIDPSINIGDATAPDTFTFARNWWFRADEPARSMPELPVAETDQKGGSDPKLGTDLQPATDSPARAHGADALPRRR